jgi:hypothetical protein
MVPGMTAVRAMVPSRSGWTRPWGVPASVTPDRSGGDGFDGADDGAGCPTATNGGYGGVQYALRYGVPIVAAGSQEDKPEAIARVAWSGVGRRIRSETPTPAAIRAAVRAVLDDRRYREAASRIGEHMAATRGMHRLAEIIGELIVANRQPGDPQPRRLS